MSLAVCANATASQVQIALNGVVRSSLISMELRWVRRSRIKSNDLNRSSEKLGELNTKSALPLNIPVYISTQQKDINLLELRDLYMNCNYSYHRFPNVDPDNGSVQEVINMEKLHTAISHSAVVVSVFCKPQNSHLRDASCSDDESSQDKTILDSDENTLSSSSYASSSDHEKQNKGIGSIGDLIQKVVPVTPSNGQLVGFGRAVSDCGLTASIYDVMVIPSLRRMGIGKLIVERIIRTLTSRGIYDIGALCSERERILFKACGFGNDILMSTTMMYTKTAQTSLEEDNQLVTRAGRRLLLAPLPRKHLQTTLNQCMISKKIEVETRNDSV